MFHLRSSVLFLGILLFISCTYMSDEQFTETIENGKKAFAEEKYELATDFFKKASAARPDNQETHFFLGYALEKLAAADGKGIPDIDTSLIEKSSEQFKKVIHISPEYKGSYLTVAMDPYSKITGIWGSVALSHLSKGNLKEARKAFIKGKSEGGYYPTILEYNKNIMRSCEPNAILFTNGDNDTFPIYYLQVVDTFRTDITIINLSLLNTPWYTQFLTESRISKRVKIDLPPAQLKNLKIRKWETRNVRIDIPESLTDKPRFLEVTISPTIYNQYLRAQDYLLLNIIQSNNWEREVYFSTTVAKVNFLGFIKYCPLEGLVMHLQPAKNQSMTIDALEKNLKTKYTFEGLSDPHFNYIPNLSELYQNYRISFYYLLKYYKNHSQTDDFNNTLTFMNEKLPLQQLPYTNERIQKAFDDL